MKSLSRNFALTLFFALAIGSFYGCAEKPITFAGPGVQIWKLKIVYTSGIEWKDQTAAIEWKDQTMVLRPSETEKDVFHVTVTIDGEATSTEGEIIYGRSKWKGEVRNGAMICTIEGISSGRFIDPQVNYGTAKGTFSKRRASGTIRLQDDHRVHQGKWTAERIS
jgi:hypothetical protein